MNIDKDTLLDEFEDNLNDAIDNSTITVSMVKDTYELIKWCKKRAYLALEQALLLMQEEQDA